MDIDPSTALNFFEETINTSSFESIVKTDCKLDPLEDLNNDNLAAFHEYIDSNDISGFEPVLGENCAKKQFGLTNLLVLVVSIVFMSLLIHFLLMRIMGEQE